MGREIERKFIADLKKFTRDLELFPSEEILQGYFPDKNGFERRVRKEGEEYTYAVKNKGDLDRSERIKRISKKRFESLWELTEGRTVSKTRYYIPWVTIGKMVEVDIYHRVLEGLVTAEIEFEGVEEARFFLPAHWFTREVTRDRRYKNRNLAEYGLPEDDE